MVSEPLSSARFLPVEKRSRKINPHPTVPDPQRKSQRKSKENSPVLTSRSPAKSAAGRPRRSSLSDAHRHAEASEEEHGQWPGHSCSATAEGSYPFGGKGSPPAVVPMGAPPKARPSHRQFGTEARGAPSRALGAPAVGARAAAVAVRDRKRRRWGSRAAAAAVAVAGAVLLARLPAAAARDDREEQRKGLGKKAPPR
jgi:hypothetical protein